MYTPCAFFAQHILLMVQGYYYTHVDVLGIQLKIKGVHMNHVLEDYKLFQAIDNPSVNSMTAEALDVIDAKYSYSGNARSDALALYYKPYHNGMHTRDVAFDTVRGCEYLEITDKDRALAIVTAIYHDYVHDLDPVHNSNEVASVEAMHSRIQQDYDFFTSDELTVSGLALLGTETILEFTTSGPRLKQTVTEQEYPTKTAKHIAEVLAGADLGKLHTPKGPYLAHKLYEEQTVGAVGATPNLQKMIGFQTMQLTLLDGGYTYPNPTLHRVFASHTKEVATYAEDVLKQLQSGSIESWDQLITQDIAFMKQHS